MFQPKLTQFIKSFLRLDKRFYVISFSLIVLNVLLYFGFSFAFKNAQPEGVLVAQDQTQIPNPSKDGSALEGTGGEMDLSQEESDRRLLIEKFKNLDPAMAIYLDSEGNMAGSGDPGEFVGEAERAGMAKHPIALEAADLPTDRYGLVDWVEGVRMGKINPRGALDPNIPPTEPLDLDVIIETKSRFQPRVLFSHKVHTFWLSCDNCHPSIFKQEAGGNPEMTMPKIASGEYCGRCHNRVSFPLTDCLRCHVEPKEETTAGSVP